jgi:Putative transposase
MVRNVQAVRIMRKALSERLSRLLLLPGRECGSRDRPLHLVRRSQRRSGCRPHRVAISNARPIAAGVTFKVKDYRVQGPRRYTTMTLRLAELIRRFLLHVRTRRQPVSSAW